MAEVVERGGTEPTLRARGAAHTAIQRTLDLQASARPRGRFARLFGLSPLRQEARGAYQDALGQLEVADLLAQLPSEFTVLHAVPVGSPDSDIDHVVIGPPGVFIIDTKSHLGKKVFATGNAFVVDGQRTSCLPNCLAQARRAAKLLGAAAGAPVTVIPLLVIVGARAIDADGNSPSVPVLDASRLVASLIRQPRVLSDEMVARLVTVAESPGTWHASPAEAESSDGPFVRLRAQAEAAQIRARRWKLWSGTALTLASPVIVIGGYTLAMELLGR